MACSELTSIPGRARVMVGELDDLVASLATADSRGDLLLARFEGRVCEVAEVMRAAYEDFLAEGKRGDLTLL